MFRLKINILLLGCLLCIPVLSAEQPRFDVSRAWFKPELLVNNQPELCTPMFQKYVDYFVSPEGTNPLAPISARAWDKHTPGALTSTIRELEWTAIGDEEKGLRLAQWRQDGKYLGIVEKSDAIGWRPPSYEYYPIDKPVSDVRVADETEEQFEGSISFLREVGKSGVFDVIYQSDSRFNEFNQNILVQLANIYAFNDRVYVALIATQASGPTLHLIASVITPRQLKLVCKFSTLPSTNAIRSASGKISYFKDFENTVADIMGGGGNCGTLNSPARAMGALREGLEALIYRPWTYQTGNYDLASWGYSGPWNYRKYLEFEAILPKVQKSLAEKYIRDYRLEPVKAHELAVKGIDAALARGFRSGSVEDDEYQQLHWALLSGKTVDEVLPFLPDLATMKENEYKDSAVAFAIGHPHLVELLLKHGFNPNQANAFGKTALMYAAQFNDLESAKILVRYGANIELATIQPLDSCTYTISSNRVTALHYAVRYASDDFITWLVRAGAVVSARDSNGKTPLDYLTKFGGTVEHENYSETSYGAQNRLLTPSKIASLASLLTPLSENQLKRQSDEMNRIAQSLYRAGKIKEAYVAVKKALSLHETNERASSNLSLIALKLGYHGESAKAADYLIKNAKSESERASAYFNTGLVCQAEGKKGFHYATIYYDGEVYCEERKGGYRGPLHYFLKAYQASPTASRANAIVEFLEQADPQRGKWLCKENDSGSNLRAVYVALNHVYFLKKEGSEISDEGFASNTNVALKVTRREDFSLGNGLSLSRWDVVVPSQGVLILGERICGRFLPALIDNDAALIELHTHGNREKINVNFRSSKPTVLVLYGNFTHWTIASESQNIHAVYVHGKDSTLEYSNDTAAVYRDTKQYAHSKPWGSSFNPNTSRVIGLSIGAIIDATGRLQVPLDDAVLNDLPRCEERVQTNCRTR